MYSVSLHTCCAFRMPTARWNVVTVSHCFPHRHSWRRGWALHKACNGDRNSRAQVSGTAEGNGDNNGMLCQAVRTDGSQCLYIETDRQTNRQTSILKDLFLVHKTLCGSLKSARSWYDVRMGIATRSPFSYENEDPGSLFSHGIRDPLVNIGTPSFTT